MFHWWPKKEKHQKIGLSRIESGSDLDGLLQRELVVIFKHSPACPVSWIAHAQVMRFAAANPELPLYMVCVRTQREIARAIASQTRVEHASPQIIVLRHGSVMCAASHEEITMDFLEDAMAAV